mmetsp:Transcript_25048/g.54502  ORF Transcript_25048/g.54502 Transcript_25048/m.54502 type:complete len:273 (-) Transcript_25048:360-1178(-)
MGAELSTGYVTECSRLHASEFAKNDDIVIHRSPSKEDALSSGPNSNVIVFDWDDTLLCSTALNHQQWSVAQLRELERRIRAILGTAMNLAETFIITNGNATWVQDSASRFMPGLLPTLRQVHVISARAMYENTYPGDPYMWKKATFNNVLHKERPVVNGKTGMNLIALGDQMPEIEAAQMVVSNIGGTSVVKTVKFKEAPTVTELLGQLEKANLELSRLVHEPESLNCFITRQDGVSTNQLEEGDSWRLVDKNRTSWLFSNLSLKELWPLFS